MLDYRIIDKAEFAVLGKSEDSGFDRFIKEGLKFWKNYVGSDNYRSLLSVYFPLENNHREAHSHRRHRSPTL